MLRRLALTLALLGPALLGSGLLQLAHDEVSHARWATDAGSSCSSGTAGCQDHAGPSRTPSRDPRQRDGRPCALCALLASLASVPPHPEPPAVVAAPLSVARAVEPEGILVPVGRPDRVTARGPPATL